MASLSSVIFMAPARKVSAATGSRYGVISAISGGGVYHVNSSGMTLTAKSRVGAVSVNDAVIVQQTGGGWLITAKIGMAEKTPEIIYI